MNIEPMEDWEKALYAVAVVGTSTHPKRGIIHFMCSICEWDEERAKMAFARLEEFGYASKIPPAPTPENPQAS